MQDKYFKASEWQSVSKNLKIDDRKFISSLSDASKTKGADKILAALDGLKIQADLLRKNVAKPDSAMKAYFDGLNKAIINEKSQAAAQKNSAGSKLSPDAERLLVTRTREGLKSMRVGKEMQVTICVIGQAAALCILDTTASHAQRDLLSESLGEKSTPRFITATGVLMGKTYAFKVKAPASGLTRKIKDALQAQLKQKYPVVTIGQDGKADDQADPRANDGIAADPDTDEPADADMDSGPSTGEDMAAPVAAAAVVPPAPPLPPATPPAPRQNESTAFNARLRVLVPRIPTAAADRRDEITRIVRLAGAAAHARDFRQADGLLDQAEALMVPSTLRGMPASLRAAIDGWQTASETVDGQIARLQGLLARSSDPELVEISELGFNALSGNFRVRLMAGLHDMDRAEGDALRAAAARTLPVATGLRDHLRKDPLVVACDTNPFGISVTVAQTLGGSVASLCNALQEVVQA